MRPVIRETFVDRRQWSVRWSAIIAGTLVAVSLWITLQMLGVGVGMAAIDTDDSGSIRGAGIGTGIWSIIVPLIALFAGGFVAARAGGVVDRGIAAIQGGVLWAATMVLGVVLMAWMISALVGTAVQAGGRMMSSAGDMMMGPGGGLMGPGGGIRGDRIMGFDADDLMAPVNERLRAQGKPTITAAQLGDATRDILHQAMRDGELDRQTLVNSLAAETDLSQADAEDVATRLEQRFDEIRGRAHRYGARAESGALRAADQTGKALLGTSIALLIGLASAIGGALLGAQRHRRAVDVGTRHDTLVTPVVPPPVD